MLAQVGGGEVAKGFPVKLMRSAILSIQNVHFLAVHTAKVHLRLHRFNLKFYGSDCLGLVKVSLSSHDDYHIGRSAIGT